MAVTQEQVESILLRENAKVEALRLLHTALDRRLDKATDDDVLKAARDYAKAWAPPQEVS